MGRCQALVRGFLAGVPARVESLDEEIGAEKYGGRWGPPASSFREESPLALPLRRMCERASNKRGIVEAVASGGRMAPSRGSAGLLARLQREGETQHEFLLGGRFF